MLLTGGAVYAARQEAVTSTLQAVGRAVAPQRGRPDVPSIPHSEPGTLDPSWRCTKLCDDIDLHADHVRAATDTLAMMDPNTSEYADLLADLEQDLELLQEVTSECAERNCECCGGESDKVG